uniref:LysM domain-containing protein n=1 Tax=Loa loa TaxID=7209 RepID=A0A1I7VUS0_LOALO
MDPGALLMEYTVAQSDSIERIAALHDCTVGELMKMNRLATRMVFPGQRLLVPCPMDENGASNVISGKRLSASQSTIAVGSNAHSSERGRIQRGPGVAVQVCGRADTSSDPSTTVLGKHSVSQVYSEKRDLVEAEEADTDTMKRFVKLKVKQITEKYGTVTGTLLVTPNALMFDPDVVHPLVLENGQDLYIMMARMEEVMSVAMFKSATVSNDPKGDREVHDRTYRDSSVPECFTVPATKETVNETSKYLADDIFKNTDVQSPRVFFDDMDLELKRKEGQEAHIEHFGSDFKSPLIVKKGNKLDKVARTARRTYSDLSNDSKQFTDDMPLWQKDEEMNRTFISGNGEDKRQYSLQPSTSVNNTRTGLTCNPLSKLGRTLSTHANTIRGSVTSGAERMTQSAMSGTKSVAQGVVSQSKVVAGTLQTGLQTSVKVAASHAKTAVGAVVAVPQGIASMSSGLFSASQHPEATYFQDEASSKTRKEQNLTALLSLKEKTEQLREEAVRNKHFFYATSMDETLNLLKPVHGLRSPARTFSATEKCTLTDSPYFMAVRLNKKKKHDKGRFPAVDIVRSSSASTEDVIANCARQEFWFAIPKHKVDAIYHFLLQWNPEKHGSGAQKIHPEELIDRQKACELLEDYGFVVLDSEVSDKFGARISLGQRLKMLIVSSKNFVRTVPMERCDRQNKVLMGDRIIEIGR